MKAKLTLVLFLNLLLCTMDVCGSDWWSGQLIWSQLPDLPPAPGKTVQPGLAGAFVGTHNGALIIGGGANFPDTLPWFGGIRMMHDQIYVLFINDNGDPEWNVNPINKLPRPVGYGMAVNTGEGVMIMGGCDQESCYAESYLLSWNPQAGIVEIETLPEMPRPLGFGTAGILDNTVYVAAGQETVRNAVATKNFFAYDLDVNLWREVGSWAGPPRIVPVSAVQGIGTSENFYLFSGRYDAPGEPVRRLTDAYCYNRYKDSWETLGQIILEGEPLPVYLHSKPAISVGNEIILFFGTGKPEILKELDTISHKISILPNGEEKDNLVNRRTYILENLRFGQDVVSFNIITKTWSKVGKIPGLAPVATSAIWWNDAIIIPGGEIRPGVRTPAVYKIEF